MAIITNSRCALGSGERLEKQLHDRLVKEGASMREGFTVWFTGFYKAGKTTLAAALERHLLKVGVNYVQRLDGDVIRQDLSRDLGFSKEDRDENIRRVSFVAELLSNNGVATLVSFISPYRAARKKAKVACLNFVEVFVNCPLAVAKRRDGNGLYARAAAGEIQNFTGISAPYEKPESPDVTVQTDIETVQECLIKIISTLEERGFIPKVSAAKRKHDTKHIAGASEG